MTMISVLRWICVLPGAVVGGLVAAGVVNLVNQLTFRWEGFDPESFMSHLYIQGVSSAVLGAATIYIGARVAPAYKTRVALALSGLVLVFGGFTMFPSVLSENWWAVYSTVVMIGAAGTLAWSIYIGETSDEDYS